MGGGLSKCYCVSKFKIKKKTFFFFFLGGEGWGEWG